MTPDVLRKFEEVEDRIRALHELVKASEASLRGHGIELGRLKTTLNDDGSFGDPVAPDPGAGIAGKDFAWGRWCVTGLKSGSTFSTTDPTLWDGQFDAGGNQSYRIFKAGLTAYGEIGYVYDGSDVHTRHRILFVNRGSSFQTKLHLRLFSGTIGASSNGVVLRVNGGYSLLTAEGDTTITVRGGTNNVALMHKAGRVIDVWGQFIDRKTVFGLDADCGRMTAGNDNGGGGGGGQGFGGTS